MLSADFLRNEAEIINYGLNSIPYQNGPSFKNSRSARQSSVSLIIRLNPQIKAKLKENFTTHFETEQNRFLKLIEDNYSYDPSKDKNHSHAFEFLFILRATNERDRFSGQVALPGGKCEKDEDDTTAAIREAEEECGIKLSDKSKYAYLGKLPKRFFVIPTPKGKLYVSYNIFFQLPVLDIGEVLQQSEIAATFWVPFQYLLNPPPEKVGLTKPFPMKIAIPRNPLLQFLGNRMMKGLEESCFWSIQLPQGQVLWGLTLCMTLNFLGYMRPYLIERPNSCFKLSKLDNIFSKGLNINVIPKTEGHLINIRRVLIEFFYYQYRQKQFENGQNTSNIIIKSIIALTFIGILLLFFSKLQ